MEKIFIKNSTLNPIFSLNTSSYSLKNNEIWKWGKNNLLPLALLEISHNSPAHRRIVQDKANYIAGAGYKCDDPRVEKFAMCCNSNYETLRTITHKLALDKTIFGNALLEVAYKDGKIALWHKDITQARLLKDKTHVVINPSWSTFQPNESLTLPIYPNIEKFSDGSLRTSILLKDYEPMFDNYGLPKYIASIGAMAIAHKTEKWNITRLDNSFSLSGVMILDGSNSTDEEADQLADEALRRFKGTPGQVMFMVKNNSETDNSKFVPITTSDDGDWQNLTSQSTDNIIIAHSWFRTLSGMEYSSGFSSERVQNEYNIALSTIIKSEQQTILDALKKIIEYFTPLDASSMEIINTPPFNPRQNYMKVWEARKADGLSYDPNSKEQSIFLSQL
ncbi:MAG: phage portal protein [Rikenellaceae bacterium]